MRLDLNHPFSECSGAKLKSHCANHGISHLKNLHGLVNVIRLRDIHVS